MNSVSFEKTHAQPYCFEPHQVRSPDIHTPSDIGSNQAIISVLHEMGQGISAYR